MPTYISLIRGINVGGHKSIKMDELRKAAESLGFKDVRTYVQSGNIVFSASKQAPAALSKKTEAVILKKFGHEVSVITKTTEEVKQAIQNNPFLKEEGLDTSKLHVTFLSGHPQSSDLKKLEAIPCGDDRYRCQGDILFLYLPNGAGESKLANAPFEKYLRLRATTRNWRTVNNLHLMAGESK
jgi:uncharacterized protein (DUF1697 family)